MPDFYGTVAGYKAYHDARGSIYTNDDTAIAAALLRASVYVDGLGFDPKGCLLWPGVKTGGRLQQRQWPRTGATDSDGTGLDPAAVPWEVDYATYEAALQEQLTPGVTSPSYVASQQIKREKVDVLETEYAVPADGGSVADVRPVLSVVVDLLRPLLRTPCDGFAMVVL